MKNIFLALALTAVSVTASAQSMPLRPQSKIQPYVQVIIGPKAAPLRRCEVYVNRTITTIYKDGKPASLPQVKTISAMNLEGQVERAYDASKKPGNYNIMIHMVAQNPEILVQGVYAPNGPLAVYKFTLLEASGRTMALKGSDAQELMQRASRECGPEFRKPLRK